jgi:hypothetical protein
LFKVAADRFREPLQGPFAVLGMNSLYPVFVGVVDIGLQPVDLPVFRRPKAVPEAVIQMNNDAGDPRDLLDPDEFGFPLPQRAFASESDLLSWSSSAWLAINAC